MGNGTVPGGNKTAKNPVSHWRVSRRSVVGESKYKPTTEPQLMGTLKTLSLALISNMLQPYLTMVI